MPTDVSRVRQVKPALETRTPSRLGRVDYEDAFLLDVAATQNRSAEQWMRLILEGSPAAIRLRLLAGWTAIGLRLRLSDSNVLGWAIRVSDPDVVLLGADSRLGMPGELLLRRQERALLFTTLVRQDNPIARALWPSIESGHVRTVRSILDLAGRRVAASG
jgi:hypothetical protein